MIWGENPLISVQHPYTSGVSLHRSAVHYSTPRSWATDTSFRMDAQLMVDGKKSGFETWKKHMEIIYQRIKTRWWQLKYFWFSPRTLGKMNPIWRLHIFQMGWFNHQPEKNGRERQDVLEIRPAGWIFSGMIFLVGVGCFLSFLLTFWAEWIHHDLAEHGRMILQNYIVKGFLPWNAENVRQRWMETKVLFAWNTTSFCSVDGKGSQVSKRYDAVFQCFLKLCSNGPPNCCKWLCPVTVEMKQGLWWLYHIYN